MFAWFGVAIGALYGLGSATGLLALLVAAPLLQPQFLVFALVRHIAGRRHGAIVRALAGASAWVATEWLVPSLLGDTIGHGLYPSRLLRQVADLGGAAGLTFLLIIVNECSRLRYASDATVRARWPGRWRSPAPCWLLMGGYGLAGG